MSTRKRIATLAVALVSDTREYEDGMNRAARKTEATERQISRSLGGLEEVGLKLGLGLIGSGGALSMLTREVREVINNIEKIPGVPAETIASVQQARLAFSESRLAIDQAIASAVSFTSWTARAAGFVAGALVYGLEDAVRAYWEFARAAEQAATAQQHQADAAKQAKEETAAAARIIQHATAIQDKLIADNEAAIAKLLKAQAAYDQKDETKGDRMTRLRAEAKELQKIADLAVIAGKVTAETTTKRAEAIENLTEAHKLEKEIGEEAKKHLKVWAELFDTINDAGVSEALENNRKYAEELSDAARDMGWAFQSAFEDAMVNGEKLSDVLQGLAKDIMRIVLRKTITEPIGGAIANLFDGFNLGSLLGFRAEGGPVSANQPYVVGEKGPELFVPRSSGSVVSNSDLRSPSSKSSGDTWYVDARGAGPNEIANLFNYIRKLDASIEERSVAANMDHARRTLGARA